MRNVTESFVVAKEWDQQCRLHGCQLAIDHSKGQKFELSRLGHVLDPLFMPYQE